MAADKNDDAKGVTAEMRHTWLSTSPTRRFWERRPHQPPRRLRKLINARRGSETVLGWIKQRGGRRQVKLHGSEKGECGAWRACDRPRSEAQNGGHGLNSALDELAGFQPGSAGRERVQMAAIAKAHQVLAKGTQVLALKLQPPRQPC